jgi:hypothetical protein
MSKDIDKGARWNPEISEELSTSKIGIICLTPENLHSDWILFEAGALSKIKENKVCTLLKDLTPADISHPLAQFQHTLITKDDVRTLLSTINTELEHPLSEKTLNGVFEKYWTDLDERIKSVSHETKAKTKTPERTERDILEEILELCRRQFRETIRRKDISKEQERLIEEIVKFKASRNLINQDFIFSSNISKEDVIKYGFLMSLIFKYQDRIKNGKIPSKEARQLIELDILNSQFSFTDSEINNLFDIFDSI